MMAKFARSLRPSQVMGSKFGDDRSPSAALRTPMVVSGLYTNTKMTEAAVG